MLGEAITKMKVFNLPQPTGLVQSISHESSVVATITMAFSTDPVARWVYPKAADYFRWFPGFVRAFAGRAISDNTAICTTNYSGVALWLGPGASADEDALVKLVENSLPTKRHAELFELFEKMGSGHPAEDHWYLPMIGVDTFRQNRGIGNGLMKLASERSDADGLPSYLESSNPRNISLYLRCGYKALGEIQVADSPPLTRMIRRAKS
ncbi:MAG TPA: GNAT family N-acetyltransferase [Pyrinomonadaceae bacterium]